MKKHCPSCNNFFDTEKENVIYCCNICRNKASSKRSREALKEDMQCLRASKSPKKPRSNEYGAWLDYSS